MSQIYKMTAGGGGGGVTSVTGSGNVTAAPTTGDVIVGLQGSTNHQLLIGTSATTFTTLSNGTSGFILTSNGAGADPTFQAPATAGTLTGVIPQFASNGTTAPGTTITSVQPIFQGMKSGSTAQVTDTLNSNDTSSGILLIEDRTYLTPYVVDPSATPGTRGTFTTVASAITAAVADGASITSLKTIYLRAGTYTENLTIPDGIQLKGFSSLYDENLGAKINGTISVATRCTFDNILFLQNGITNSFNFATGAIASIRNCQIEGPITGADGIVDLLDCLLNDITSTGLSIRINYCQTAQSGSVWSISALSITARWSSLPADIILSGTGNVQLYHGIFPGAANVTGTSSTLSRFINCTYHNVGAEGVLIAATITAVVENTHSEIAQPLGIYSSAVTVVGNNATQGNIVQSVAVTSTPYTTIIGNYYHGINVAAATAITVTTTNLGIDSVSIYKDQSGAAATNNITLTPQTGLIDGAASYVITTNYGSISLKFDGTNFWVL